MRISQVIVAAFLAISATAAAAQTPVRFALDWRFEGPAAPYFVALDKGFYKDEGLDVTIDPGASSVEPINRVATGTYQIGFADINSLIKFRDNPDNPPVKAVQMIYDTPAFSIVTLKDKGISKPKDLEGKILGAPAADGSYAQWPIFVDANDIDVDKVTIDNIGFPVREPMLAQGKVDAIAGFWFSCYMNLKANGVDDDDIVVMLLGDHGVELYGNALMVNPEFAEKNPEAVAGFVRATIKGIQETLKDPEAAIESLMARNAIADRDVELERLKMSLEKNFVNDDVRKNGFGDVDMDRLEKAMDQIGLTFEYTNRPKAADIFTAEYLPPLEERQVPN